MQRAVSAGPSAPHLHFQGALSSPFSTITSPLQQDKRPEIPLNSLRQQQHDRSAIITEPTQLPRNQTLFALIHQRQNGGFVNNVLRNERSATLAPELSSVMESGGREEDIDMLGMSSYGNASDTLQRGKRIAGLKVFDGVSDNITDGTASDSAPVTPSSHVTAENQLPSPPPSHASIVSGRVKKQQVVFKSPFATFKKPSSPASARTAPTCTFIGSNTRRVRAGTVDSHASSVTLLLTRSQRDASVASHTSDASARTGVTRGQKRVRQFQVSSDEDESDYAPSEPDSPLANNKPIKNTRGLPAVKKSKVADGPAVESKPRTENEKMKGKFGFKTAPARAPTTRPASSAFKAKTPASPKYPAKKKFLPRPTRRAAAKVAENKLHKYYEAEKEFQTSLAIEEADELEEAVLPERMSSISIMSALSNGQKVASAREALSNGDELVGLLVHDEKTSKQGSGGT